MNDNLEAVREHYRPAGLVERLKAALATFGPEERLLTPQQLAPLDHFHTRGVVATSELAKLADVTEHSIVLDIGSGIGGPARFLAATRGCRVAGVDLSEPFVDAARYLTARTGQTDRVAFDLGSALQLPVADASFDVALLQHVAMNIADRPVLYRESRRALRPGGKLAIFDIVSRGGTPHYPVPWAETPETSFLLSAAETCRTIETAGFAPVVVRDDTEAARAWAEGLKDSGPPPMPHLGVVMGQRFPELTGNLARSLLEGRVGILTAVFRAEDRGDSK